MQAYSSPTTFVSPDRKYEVNTQLFSSPTPSSAHRQSMVAADLEQLRAARRVSSNNIFERGMTPDQDSYRRTSYPVGRDRREHTTGQNVSSLQSSKLYQSARKNLQGEVQIDYREPSQRFTPATHDNYISDHEDASYQTPLRKRDKLKQKLEEMRHQYGSEEKHRRRKSENDTETPKKKGQNNSIEKSGRYYHDKHENSPLEEHFQHRQRLPVHEIQTKDDDMDLSLATAPTMCSTETDGTSFRAVGRLGNHYRSRREFIEEEDEASLQNSNADSEYTIMTRKTVEEYQDEVSLQPSTADTEFTMMRKTIEACKDSEADSTFSVLRKTIGTMPGQYMLTAKKLKLKDDPKCDASQDSFKSKLKEQIIESKRSTSSSSSDSSIKTKDEYSLSSSKDESQFPSQTDLYHGDTTDSYGDENRSLDLSLDTYSTASSKRRLSAGYQSDQSRYERLQKIRNGKSWLDDESTAGSSASVEKKKSLGRRSISRRKQDSRSAEQSINDTPPPPPPPPPPPQNQQRPNYSSPHLRRQNTIDSAEDPRDRDDLSFDNGSAKKMPHETPPPPPPPPRPSSSQRHTVYMNISPHIQRQNTYDSAEDPRMASGSKVDNLSVNTLHSSPVLSIDRRRGVVAPEHSYYNHVPQEGLQQKQREDKAQEERQKLMDLRSGKISSPNPPKLASPFPKSENAPMPNKSTGKSEREEERQKLQSRQSGSKQSGLSKRAHDIRDQRKKNRANEREQHTSSGKGSFDEPVNKKKTPASHETRETKVSENSKLVSKREDSHVSSSRETKRERQFISVSSSRESVDESLDKKKIRTDHEALDKNDSESMELDSEVERNLVSSQQNSESKPLQKQKSAISENREKQVSKSSKLVVNTSTGKAKETNDISSNSSKRSEGKPHSSGRNVDTGLNSHHNKQHSLKCKKKSEEEGSESKTQNRGGSDKQKREKRVVVSPRLGAKKVRTPKRYSTSKKSFGTESLESPLSKADLKGKVMTGQFPKHIVNPTIRQKSCERIAGYIVWCSHGFEKPIPGFSWTPPTKMFDTIFQTVEEANLRAKYLFHLKNAFGIDEETMLDKYDYGEKVKKKCKTFYCTPMESGRTWTVAVVPAEIFEWMDHVDFNRHPFDEIDEVGSTIGSAIGSAIGSLH